MKEIHVAEAFNKEAIKVIAGRVGGTLRTDGNGRKYTTVYALTLTDRELLSAAITELSMLSNDGGDGDRTAISEALDKIRKVLSTE